jgi:molybdopterin converting factor subunit 1
MLVRVLLFGALRELMTPGSGTMELPERATVAQLLERCMEAAPDARSFLGSLAVAVNREYAAPTTVLRDGDEVALLPPVSGGCSEICLVRLQREAIDAAAFLKQMRSGADGAVVIFDGVVRNNTRGRRTLYLDYEAYEEMALAQMKALVRDAKARFDVREISLVHRLGRLEIGESSVWIAVASAQRAAAFEACRFVIDTLKKTVPIWKKEYFVDGAVWADGEPFPENLLSV